MEGGIKLDQELQQFESLKDSLDVNILSASFDYGRESLGILPPDFGRESLGFSNPTIIDDIQQDSFEIRNLLQLSTFDNRASLSSGKESLGILQLSALDTRFSLPNSKTPDLLFTAINETENEGVCDFLNKAFLFPTTRHFSLASSGSHVSFNTNSFEEPSKIYSASPCDNIFSTSGVESVSTILNKNILPSEIHGRLRMKSLPIFNTDAVNIGMELFFDKDLGKLSYSQNHISNVESITSILNEGKYISPSEIDSFITPLPDINHELVIAVDKSSVDTKKTANISQTHKSNGKDDSKANNEDILHDSIFVEGKYFADQIANGSIFDDSYCNEVGILDNIPHPNWPEIQSPDKNIQTELIISGTNKDHVQSSSDTELKETTSKIEHIPKCAKALLHNLSEILNNTTLSDQQKSEGQHLLTSLASLLSDELNAKSCNLDDSGHSSSINDISDPEKVPNDYYEVLNQRSTSADTRPEDHSIKNISNSKAKSKISDLKSKRLSISLNLALPSKVTHPSLLKKGSLSKIGLDNSKTKTGSGNSSIKSNNQSADNVSVSSMQSNLKVKMNTDVSRKGPLKAVLPLKELRKTGKVVTPEKTEHILSTMIQSKRTSTPINEPKLKPVASSTPTQRVQLKMNNDDLSGRKSLPRTFKTDSTNRTSSIPHSEQPYSNNTSDAVQPKKKLTLSTYSPKDKSISRLQLQTNFQYGGNGKRRNTISSFKKEQLLGRPRSNSLPKEPVGIMSTIGRIKTSLLNSPDFKNFSTKSLLKENNNNSGSGPNGSGRSSLGLKTDLLSKFKKVGKENREK